MHNHKPNPNFVYSKYLYYCLLTTIKGEIKKYVVETVRANIGISLYQEIIPIAHQKHFVIIEAVENRVHVIDDLEKI